MCFIFLANCILFAYALSASAQTILRGTVFEEENGVPFANIGIENSSKGTSADENGNFTLEIDNPEAAVLEVTSVGYFKYRFKPDTINGYPSNIRINMKASDLLLNQIVITGNMKQTYLKESPVKVEVLTSAFLSKTPTNNIVEALHTVNGVQEQVNCGVCGTNAIRINGMEGPYTLLLIDGMPIMSSLASVYGLNGIPTSLVEQIEIVKGPSSTLYGTEAVGGVINIITKHPDESPKLALNSFFTSHGEWNLNAAVTMKSSNKIFSTFGLNTYYNQYRFDYNNDGFTDIPLSKRISLYNKWEFNGKDSGKSSITIRYYGEDRFGGQMQWQPADKGGDRVYGEAIKTNRFELIGSSPVRLFDQDIRVDYSYTLHKQDSYYGKTHYKADQSVLFANFVWDKQLNNHNLLTGVTVRNNQYEDNTPASSDEKIWVPGVFVQDEWKLNHSTLLLSGVRFDYHSYHGMIFSPRVNIKQKVGEYTSLRLNMGTGFRTVNLFTEDHAALTGARTVVIREKLKPERSYNANLNLNHVFIWGESTGTIDLDAFYTYFTNKIIPDYETDNQYIYYTNLLGYAVSKGVSFGIQQSFLFPLTISLGGTLQDVYQVKENITSNDEKRTPQLFSPKLSATFTVSYIIKPWELSIDYTGQIMGPQHLPTYASPYERDEISPWYTIQNVQLNKKIGTRLEAYVAVKNLWDWTQDSPLIAPEDPFGPNFDTAYAWGPLQPRRYLLGLKFTVNQ